MDPALRRSSSAAAGNDAPASSVPPPSTKPAPGNNAAGSTTTTASRQRKKNLLASAAACVVVLFAVALLAGTGTGGGGAPVVTPFSSGGRASAANLRGIGNVGNDDRGTLRPRPLVVAGPSGVGKGTLIGMLLDRYNNKSSSPANGGAGGSGRNSTFAPAVSSSAVPPPHGGAYFGLSVSHTTRGPRPGEIEGVHYHFTTREQLQAGIEKGDFVEWNEVHGNLYGTSYASIQSVSSSGLVPVIEVDVQGVKRIKERQQSAASASPSSSSSPTQLDPPLYLFIAPPSIKTLEDRLRGRATETEDAIRTRLGNAAREIEYGRGEGNFDRVLSHEDVSTSMPELVRIMEGWYPHLKGANGAGAEHEIQAIGGGRTAVTEASKKD